MYNSESALQSNRQIIGVVNFLLFIGISFCSLTVIGQCTKHTFTSNVGSMGTNSTFAALPRTGQNATYPFTFVASGTGSGSISNSVGEMIVSIVGGLSSNYEMSVTRTDNASFDLDTLTLENGFGFNSASVTITGKSGGSAVSGAVFNGTMPATGSTNVKLDLSGDSDFDNIDEFVVTFGTPFGTAWSFIDITTCPVPVTPVSSTISAQTNNVCNGDALGSLTVTASDGSTPYTYNWSNSATSSTISTLGAGTYTVTVTDAGGITATSSATITEPTALNTTISSQTNVACFGENTGSLTASVTGGTSPYTYNWNSGETSATITGKAAGTYTVSVLDANGCGEGPPP